MNERIDNINTEREEADEKKRRNTICYKAEDFKSKNVQQMHENMKEMEKNKQEEEEKKQKEIHEKKIVDKTKMNERIDNINSERDEADEKKEGILYVIMLKILNQKMFNKCMKI